MNGTAIEFETTVEDGVIHIPEEYRETAARFSVPLYVTLEENRQSKIVSRRKAGRVIAEDVLAPCISTSGWKFNRDEAHER